MTEQFTSEETARHIERAIAESPVIGQCLNDDGRCGNDVTEYEVAIASASASPLPCSRCVMAEVVDMFGL